MSLHQFFVRYCRPLDVSSIISDTVATRMGLLKYIIGGLSTYYITCLSTGRMLFVHDYLDAQFVDQLLSPSIVVPIVIIIANIVLVLIDDTIGRRRAVRSAVAPIYNQICREIHESIVSGQPDRRPEVRVSMHKATKGVSGVTLRNIGRHQHTAPFRLSPVRFRPGQGCVGLAYQANSVLLKDLDTVTTADKRVYNRACKEETKIPRHKCWRLSVQSRYFLSVPIQDSADRPWGVLTVDSTGAQLENARRSRTIEDTLDKYQIVFHDREVD